MPTGPDLKRILEFMAGGLPIDEYLPMMREELALTADLRAPRWHKDDVNPDKPFKVVIVGAGMSGIIAAYRLSRGRRPVRRAREERRRRRHLAREQLPGLPGRHPEPLLQLLVRPARRLAAASTARAPSCYRYFRECVDEFGIRPNIRFGTEVSSIACDDETAMWTVSTVDRDGAEANHRRPTR